MTMNVEPEMGDVEHEEMAMGRRYGLQQARPSSVRSQSHSTASLIILDTYLIPLFHAELTGVQEGSTTARFIP